MEQPSSTALPCFVLSCPRAVFDFDLVWLVGVCVVVCMLYFAKVVWILLRVNAVGSFDYFVFIPVFETSSSFLLVSLLYFGVFLVW